MARFCIFNSWVTNPNASDVAASLVLPAILPKGIETDSMSRVLKFRAEQTEARATYRTNVETLAENLTSVNDRGHALELVEDFERDLASGRAIGGSRAVAKLVDHKHSALVVGLPVAIGTIIGNTDGTNWGLLGKACGLGLIATMADANISSRAKWKCSEAYYHLKLHGYFSPAHTPEGPMPRDSRIFHEFMDD
jgi:hypothetical protein